MPTGTILQWSYQEVCSTPVNLTLNIFNVKVNRVEKLNIKEPIISIIASGNSINQLSDSDIDYICSNTYSIGFNYSPCRFKKLSQVFYIDTRVKRYLDSIKGDLIKSGTRVTTEKNKRLVDVYYGTGKGKNICADKDDKRGKPREIFIQRYNLSITTLLRMLETYYPKKKFLIFGLDLCVGEDNVLKWYDKYIESDIVDRVGQLPKNDLLSSGLRRHSHPETGYQNTAKELDQIVRGGCGPTKGNLFFNANPDSKYERFKKVDWKQFIETNK